MSELELVNEVHTRAKKLVEFKTIEYPHEEVGCRSFRNQEIEVIELLSDPEGDALIVYFTDESGEVVRAYDWACRKGKTSVKYKREHLQATLDELTKLQVLDDLANV